MLYTFKRTIVELYEVEADNRVEAKRKFEEEGIESYERIILAETGPVKVS